MDGAVQQGARRAPSDKHRAEQLHASGLTDETIAIAELYTEYDPRQVQKLLKWKKIWPRGQGNSLVFPFFVPGKAEPIGHRVRPTTPRVTGKKRDGSPKVAKYEAPVGVPALVYFPTRARTLRWLGDAQRTLYWAEGEKKALLLDQLGLACVGLTGVNNSHDAAHRKASGGEYRLHPLIREHVKVDGRAHTIVFDADARSNSDVYSAARQLTRMLLDAGAASVRFVCPPGSAEQPKQGIDDFFVASGESSTRALLDTPEEIEPALANDDWQRRLTTDKDDNVKSTLANATLILSHDPAWDGVIGYDLRAEQPMFTRRPPFRGVPEALLAAPRVLTDGDDVRVAQWLEETHRITLGLPQLHAALNAAAEMSPFDRVREYLSSVSWDGVPRLDTWPETYLGVEVCDDKLDASQRGGRQAAGYVRAVGRKWMISCVARAFDPGCKCDHVLVLEGAQGIGKSTALRVLAGDEYFGDDVPAIGSKDAQQYLGALWIIELAEMDAATRAEASTLKRFLTTTVDRYRPPYGRRMILHARRCVFAGSVNFEEYLRDATGGRRFWPLSCKSINVDGLKAVRDQLWAEAVAAYRKDERWHLDASADRDVANEATKEQGKRLESEPWEEKIAEYLANPTTPSFLTTTAVLEGAIRLRLENIDKRASNSAGAIMRRLGWSYGEGKGRVRGWHKPPPADGEGLK